MVVHDVDQEFGRLRKCFKGNVLKRQLDIFEAFLKEDYELVQDLYPSLPYNKNKGCPEQEFVGNWINIIYGGWIGIPTTNTTRTVQLLKTEP